MTRNATPIDLASEAAELLKEGDLLAHCGCGGWRLVVNDRMVSDAAVEALKQGTGLGGRLVPQDDQLPGMPKRMAQTWRWARARKRTPELV